MSDANIQFISAEELHALAELERDAEVARSSEGMMNDMEKVYKNLGGPEFMQAWAEEQPGDFFKLKAKIALAAKKHENRTQRILIGLPTTALDE